MTDIVLAASHGTSSPEGRAAVRRLVEAVAGALTQPVIGCHVDVEQPDVPSSLESAAREAGHAIIVPLLLSAGYHVFVDLADAAEASPIPATVTPALGPDARLVEVLVERLQEAGHRPGDQVVLAAAGSSDSRAVADCHRTAALLAGRIGSAVSAGFVSAAAPSLPEAVAAARSRAPGSRVLIATYLLAPGYFAQLAAAAGADITTEPLLTPTSTPDQLVRIVADRVGAVRRLSAV
ncbi:CbiX/SirB N-terminal domain-containing protein [Microbacterium sp. X-17]|uniref:sirohydrochlorin chelatase n=1 Tax=Microbacterium sp. X-17 TaxID=3144404 RepID=UPI0031F522D8